MSKVWTAGIHNTGDVADTDDLWVTTNKSDVAAAGVSYDDLIGLNIQATKELAAKVEMLERVIMADPKLKEIYEQEVIMDTLKGEGK